MRWRWRWPRRGPNGDAAKRAEQEALLRSAQRATPLYEALAPVLSQLPADEFAARVRAAMSVERPP